MKTINFPYIAFLLSTSLLLLVMKGSQTNADGETLIPLLTLLVVSEFSFFVTAIAFYIGIKQIKKAGFQLIYTAVTLMCLLLSIRSLFYGIALWPL